MEENKKETKTEEKKVVDKKATEVKKEEKKVTDKKQAEVKKEEKKPADKKVAETKKEEKKPVEKKTTEPKKEKKNNKVAIIGAVIVVIALVVVLAGMFLMPETPKKVVENALTELRNGSYAQSMLSGLLQGENVNAEAQKLLFEKLEWKVLEEKEEADKATVEVEITNKDFKVIIGNYMQKALKAALIDPNINKEEMTNYLMEELRNEEVENVTNKNTISLEKKDGKWEIVEEDSFINAVLPGLYEAVNSLEQE